MVVDSNNICHNPLVNGYYYRLGVCETLCNCGVEMNWDKRWWIVGLVIMTLFVGVFVYINIAFIPPIKTMDAIWRAEQEAR